MYEYKVIACFDDYKGMQDKMNEFAKEGWRVVSVVVNDSAMQHFIVTLEKKN